MAPYTPTGGAPSSQEQFYNMLMKILSSSQQAPSYQPTAIQAPPPRPMMPAPQYGQRPQQPGMMGNNIGFRTGNFNANVNIDPLLQLLFSQRGAQNGIPAMIGGVNPNTQPFGAGGMY